jgi:hypothetical protein
MKEYNEVGVPQDLVDTFCTKCWEGDFDGILALFKNPNANQKLYVNSTNSRYHFVDGG